MKKEALHSGRTLKNREGTSWKTHSEKIRNQYPVEAADPDWTAGEEKKKLLGVCRKPAKVDIVNLAYLKGRFLKIPLEELYVDYSLSHKRAMSSVGRMQSLGSRNAELYFLSKDRAAIAEEFAALMGFYDPVIASDVGEGAKKLNDVELKFLIAESMNVTQIATVLASILVHLPFCLEVCGY